MLVYATVRVTNYNKYVPTKYISSYESSYTYLYFIIGQFS
jgi:hypothetical protein